MRKTAVEIILEGVSNGSITQKDAIILLEAVNQKGNTTFMPMPYQPNPYQTSTPGWKPIIDWTYDPNRTDQPWCTTTNYNTNERTDT